MQLCYLAFNMRRVGLAAISEDEAEAHLQKTTTLEVALFIKDGIKILKMGYGFSPTLQSFLVKKDYIQTTR